MNWKDYWFTAKRKFEVIYYEDVKIGIRVIRERRRSLYSRSRRSFGERGNNKSGVVNLDKKKFIRDFEYMNNHLKKYKGTSGFVFGFERVE